MDIPWDTTGISMDDFPTVPDGTYELKITNTESTVSKNSGNPLVIVDTEVIDSLEGNGVRIRHYVTIMPAKDENGKPTPGAGIAKKFLKSIGEPFEGKIDIVPSNWKGKKFTAGIIREKYEGKLQNKIKWTQSYRPDENVIKKASEEVDF